MQNTARPNILRTISRMLPLSLFNLIFQLIEWISSTLKDLMGRFFGKTIHFDSGRTVRIGPKIAEGGFSYVFKATDVDTRTTFALKRIQCEDKHALQACKHEAEVHHAVGEHKNAMALLGMVYEEKVCYMLFPFMPHSLRSEVNRRIFIDHGKTDRVPPWSETAALQIFQGILAGVDALHQANYSHRDIKLENVLFTGSNNLQTPVLMDFGSVGPTIEPVATRKQVLTLVESASSHTTMPYRPPELFDGGLRAGDPEVDFRKVDVWSLGCTLFAILYGASPFESEFNRSNGSIKIVDCTHLRIIGSLPKPPERSDPAKWYSPQIRELYEWMLTQDRIQRPSLGQVISRVDALVDSDASFPTDNWV